MNITDLDRKEVAKIISLSNIDKSFTKRLMDLGIYESATVVMLNKLSSNRLYIIEVDDIEICLRKEDAEKIEVKK
ncbi:MAG: FeoA domain protein [Candidatus Izimaplasma bacterium HR2]|nr:MAG: FeoA domain protein [Candidatus Izimaplasma bacterium HR2]